MTEEEYEKRYAAIRVRAREGAAKTGWPVWKHGDYSHFPETRLAYGLPPEPPTKSNDR